MDAKSVGLFRLECLKIHRSQLRRGCDRGHRDRESGRGDHDHGHYDHENDHGGRRAHDCNCGLECGSC